MENMSDYSLITEEHVRTTLKVDKGDSAELSSWKIEDFTKKGDNFGSVVTSVKVQYQLDGQSENVTYIIKMKLDANNSYGGYKFLTDALFFKETKFLEKVAPALSSELTAVGQEPLRIPRQFHYSLQKDKGILFLEDLRARGFVMFDRTKGLDIPHANLVLKEVAKFHAASILLQAKNLDEDLADKYSSLQLNWHNHSDQAENVFNMIVASSFDGAVKMLNKVGGYEKAEQWLKENKDNVFNIFKKQIVRKAPFDVINHGDCWNNNFLFRYSDDGTPVEVMLIDLQLTQKASVGNDLNYLLFTSFTGDVRKPNLDSLLRMYYDTFSDVLKAGNTAMPFTFEQLLQEFRDKNEYGLLFATAFSDSLVRPSEEIPDFNVSSEEEFSKLMEDWNESALESLETNPLFKPRFLAIYDEMMENGLFD